MKTSTSLDHRAYRNSPLSSCSLTYFSLFCDFKREYPEDYKFTPFKTVLPGQSLADINWYPNSNNINNILNFPYITKPKGF